ncbi:hypothetical protein [Streptomyces olivaceus]|uniref:hypothetical protein n=1 Tax=Streptomyces olivaceus TaxID=47716 RepID=UPI0037214736
MITTTITHDKVNGTVARLSDSHRWVGSTLERHGFTWSRAHQAYALPGTRTWAFDPYRVGRATRQLRRNGFTVRVDVDNTTPEADPIADELDRLLDIAYTAQHLGAAYQSDQRDHADKITEQHRTQIQGAVTAACDRLDRLAQRLGWDLPEILHINFVLNDAWVAVGLPPF